MRIPARIGSHEVIGRIAEGRSSQIVLARSPFGKRVAIKRGATLRDEARVTSEMHHPQVIALFDAGVDRGRDYMVLEYVFGWNVRSVLSTAEVARQPIPIDVALAVARDIALGLTHIHARGYLHRDVTPSNVLIGEEGVVKLIDFGSSLTGRRDGVTRYAAPELLRGEVVDERSDVYSLAVMLYELSTCTRLFYGDKPMRMILEGEVPPPSSLRKDYPTALEAVVQRGMSRDPGKRFENATELAIALEELAARRGVPLSPLRISSYVRDLFGRVDTGTPTRMANTGVYRR